MVYIEKMIKTIITVIGAIMFCALLGLAFPVLREPLLFLWTTIWTIFKGFFFADVLQKWILYLVIAGGITALGFWIGRRQEKKIWLVVSIVMDIVMFIGFWNYK